MLSSITTHIHTQPHSHWLSYTHHSLLNVCGQQSDSTCSSTYTFQGEVLFSRPFDICLKFTLSSLAYLSLGCASWPIRITKLSLALIRVGKKTAISSWPIRISKLSLALICVGKQTAVSSWPIRISKLGLALICVGYQMVVLSWSIRISKLVLVLLCMDSSLVLPFMYFKARLSLDMHGLANGGPILS